jgi:DNA (cytosine-5)-methyltransferase 1
MAIVALDTEQQGEAAYCMTTGEFTQVTEEKTPTLMARDYKDPPLVAKAADPSGFNGQDVYNDHQVLDPPNEEPNYIVRRLTPTECARLQGFPDWWCENLNTEDPTAEEVAFWSDVFETHRKIVTGASKPKTEKQIRKWLADPYSDSAEYKLWGNGVALPCVYFVLSGIVWASQLNE